MNILKQVIKIPADRSEANLLANLLTSVVENLSSGLPSFSKPTNGQGATRTREGGGGVRIYCKTIALTTRLQVAYRFAKERRLVSF